MFFDFSNVAFEQKADLSFFHPKKAHISFVCAWTDLKRRQKVCICQQYLFVLLRSTNASNWHQILASNHNTASRLILNFLCLSLETTISKLQGDERSYSDFSLRIKSRHSAWNAKLSTCWQEGSKSLQVIVQEKKIATSTVKAARLPRKLNVQRSRLWMLCPHRTQNITNNITKPLDFSMLHDEWNTKRPSNPRSAWCAFECEIMSFFCAQVAPRAQSVPGSWE